MPGSDAASMTALGIKLSGLGAGSEVNLWRLEVRDELPEFLPKVKDFPGWWEGAPKIYVLPEAKQLWEKAAKVGHARAMTFLGCALTGGGDLAGREWLERSSDLGDFDALLHLGLSWEDTDPERAFSFYLRAAEQAHPSAMAECGASLFATHLDEAMHWYREAASRGEVMALFNLALMAYHGPDRASAEPVFRDSAERGFPPAMFMLARMLGDKGPEQAHQLWVEADARGHYWSTLSLAGAARKRGTLRGSHIETDYLWRAMELGSGDAAYALGAAGVGTLRRKMWQKAKELGVDPDLEPPLPKRHLRWTFGMPDAERE